MYTHTYMHTYMHSYIQTYSRLLRPEKRCGLMCKFGTRLDRRTDHHWCPNALVTLATIDSTFSLELRGLGRNTPGKEGEHHGSCVYFVPNSFPRSKFVFLSFASFLRRWIVVCEDGLFPFFLSRWSSIVF